MTEEYKLPYSGSEINRKLRDVDTKARIIPLTTIEYEALENPNANNLYIITDTTDIDQIYNPESENAQSGKAVAEAITGVKYFNIETDGTISLKPQYRDAAIEFEKNEDNYTNFSSLDKDICDTMQSYATSNKTAGKEGSLINLLPEVLHIPSMINGITVTKLAPAMFAYNKKVKKVVLPKTITDIPIGCFTYAINLTEVANVENIKTIGYCAFCASGIIEMDLPKLETLDKKVFLKAGHLKTINLGKVTVIPERCFQFCISLEEIIRNKETDTDTGITEVGMAAFHYTALKKADFVNDLIIIGNYAFVQCHLNFNWFKFNQKMQNAGIQVQYGTKATPLQVHEENGLIPECYSIRTDACELPAPLRIDQGNPEWADTPMNNSETYNTGCMFFSTMNAYCGIKNLNYDEPYSLVEINKNIKVPDEYIENYNNGADLNAYYNEFQETNRYPLKFGIIVKYTGDATNETIQSYTHRTDYQWCKEHNKPEEETYRIENTNERFIKNNYYRLTDTLDKNDPKYDTEYPTHKYYERVWRWVDLGTVITNMDLFASGHYYTTSQWYKGLGLIQSELKYLKDLSFKDVYDDIITSLQNGSYVVLGVPNTYNAQIGHAIVVYGVKPNGELLFVDSSVPGLEALEDYRAITGSALLQNIIDGNGGNYFTLSEGTTKSLLNETIDNKYFGIEENGTIYLKPEYRGATIDFATDSSIKQDLGEDNCAILLSYAKSDNGTGKEGSKINKLPEILHIPDSVNGIEVKYLAPAMFAYNKRVKQIILPFSIKAIPSECFAYAIHLEKVLNTENVKSVGYASFFATRIKEIEFKILAHVTKKAFAKSAHLEKINIGGVTKIPDRCFSDCTYLEKIEHSNTITSVGGASFYNTRSLKHIDFIDDLEEIGACAFGATGIIYDWTKLEYTTDKNEKEQGKVYLAPNGTKPLDNTPLQLNVLVEGRIANGEWSDKISESYTTRVKANRLNAPAVLFEQSNPKWAKDKLNNYPAEEGYLPIELGCAFHSIMGAYCGIRGLKYDNPYDLIRINEEIVVPDGAVDKITSEEVMNSYEAEEFIYYGDVFKANFGKIVQYTGTDGKYKSNNHYVLVKNSDTSPVTYKWHSLEKDTLTNLDLFIPSPFSESRNKFIQGLGLKVEETDWISPEKYSNIIEALQKGYYVTLNIPNGMGSGAGHDILLYGVNADQEVLYVNTSTMGLREIEDYSAFVGSALLQNLAVTKIPAGANSLEDDPTSLFDRMGGTYAIIGEDTTKSLLNTKMDKFGNVSSSNWDYTQVIGTDGFALVKDDNFNAGIAIGRSNLQGASDSNNVVTVVGDVVRLVDSENNPIQITNLAKPENLSHAANKKYVDDEITKIDGAKQDTLVSGTNIKTINGESILGSGNISLQISEGGISPTIDVAEIENGHKVSITDKDGTTSFDVLNGAKGDKGDTGASGEDGTSVTITKITESTADGGSNVVTFSDGKTLIVKNGSKGSSGEGGTVDLSSKMDKFGEVNDTSESRTSITTQKDLWLSSSDLMLGANSIYVTDPYFEGLGKITNLATPTNNNDAVNKAYVDNKTNLTAQEGSIYLTAQDGSIYLSGSSVQVFGADGESAGKISNLATPIDNTDAANKAYVDTKIDETDDKIDNVYALLQEAITRMDMSLIKMDYRSITQTETVSQLTFSYDFEPKFVSFNTTTARGTFSKAFPTIETNTVMNGIYSNTWVKENLVDNQPSMNHLIMLQKDSSMAAGTANVSVSTTVTNTKISVAKDETTGKWNLTISGADGVSGSTTVLTRIIGGSNITYSLFVAG